MQVMPGTAAGIARQMAWPGYEDRQAYWPCHRRSIRRTTCARRMIRFDDAFAALAAYNGGPGNAGKWWLLAGRRRPLCRG